MNCAICEYEDCDELILDLFICNSCSHIFKHEPESNGVVPFESIHLFEEPVQSVCEYLKNANSGRTLVFIIPSMNFYTLDLKPSMFYKNTINHYFNQKSLMIFLKRTGLKPITQNNQWEGNVCKTTLYCRVR